MDDAAGQKSDGQVLSAFRAFSGAPGVWADEKKMLGTAFPI